MNSEVLNVRSVRAQSDYDNNLTYKIFLFQFVNYYSAIIYLAFIKGKCVALSHYTVVYL